MDEKSAPEQSVEVETEAASSTFGSSATGMSGEPTSDDFSEQAFRKAMAEKYGDPDAGAAPLFLEDLLGYFMPLDGGEVDLSRFSGLSANEIAPHLTERFAKASLAVEQVNPNAIAHRIFSVAHEPGTSIAEFEASLEKELLVSVTAPDGRAAFLSFTLVEEPFDKEEVEDYRDKLYRSITAAEGDAQLAADSSEAYRQLPVYVFLLHDGTDPLAHEVFRLDREFLSARGRTWNIYFHTAQDAWPLFFGELAETPAPEPRTDSARIFMLSDEALSSAADDLLGYDRYAEALADLIDSEDTGTPLTIAINAKWGVGKTSLARMIEEELSAPTRHGLAGSNRTHWFNAWMHDEATNLGHAFLLDFAQHVNAMRSRWDRIRAPLPDALRSDEVVLRGRRIMVRLAWAALFVLCIALVEFAHLDPVKSLKLSSNGPAGDSTPWWANMILLFVLSGVLLKLILDNQSTVSRFLHSRPRAVDSGSLAAVREELRKLVRQVTPPGRKFVVFLDDLERCRPPRSIDVLETVNQLLDFDPVVTVIIADMPAVATNAEIKYRDLAERYNPDTETSAESGDGKESAKSVYGRLFLQKFIQLQFDLPHMREDKVRRLVEQLMDGRDAEEELTRAERAVGPSEGPGDGRLRRPSLLAVWLGQIPQALRPLVDPLVPERPFAVWGSHGSDLADGLALMAATLSTPFRHAVRGGLGATVLSSAVPLRYGRALRAAHSFAVQLAALSLLVAGVLAFSTIGQIFVVGLLSGVGWASTVSIASDMLTNKLVPASYESGPYSVWLTVLAGLVLLWALLSLALFVLAVVARGAHMRDVRAQYARERQAIDTLIAETDVDAEAFDENAPAVTSLDADTRRFLYRQARLAKLENDSDVFREARNFALGHITPVPRNTKRLINRLRLQIGLLDRSGAFRETELTADQIGKWIVLQDRWPDLASAIAVRSSLMGRLEGEARQIVPIDDGAKADKADAALKSVGLYYPEDSRNRLFALLADTPRLAPTIDIILNYGRHETDEEEAA